MNNLKQNIMDKIHTGQVKQKPGWYFAVSTFGIGLLGIILFFVSIFWSSFLLLTLHEYSMFAEIGIGLALLLQNVLFWIFIVCGIAAGVLCYRWLRDHTSLYRYRHVYTGVIVIAILTGVGVSMNIVDREATLLHKGGKNIPGFSNFDKSIRPPRPEIITEGKIILSYEDILVIQEKYHKENIYIKVPSEIFIMKNFSTGNRVLVIGTREDDIIYAQDVIVK